MHYDFRSLGHACGHICGLKMVECGTLINDKWDLHKRVLFFFLPASKMILYDFELEVQKVYLSHLEDFYFQEY